MNPSLRYTVKNADSDDQTVDGTASKVILKPDCKTAENIERKQQAEYKP